MNESTLPKPLSATATPPGAMPALDPATLPLWGNRLIEASAGTGKTWTISALYVRLVLGHGGPAAFGRALMPADILVMTFTRAATRELSDRIRARLVQAANCLRSPDPEQAAQGDSFLLALLADLPPGPERQQAAWRLSLAAEAMDDAAVFTIDAWCQRMLREHAFDSGNLFDETLVADEKALRLQATQDYWRQQVYPLSVAELGQLGACSSFQSLDSLVADMGGLADASVPRADALSRQTLAEAMADAVARRQAALDALRQGWVERAQAMQDWVDGQLASRKGDWDGRRLSAAHTRKWLDALRRWAQGEGDAPALTDAAWERLSPAGLVGARKHAPDGWGEADAPAEFHACAALPAQLQALPELHATLRAHAAVWVGQRAQRLKRQAGQFGFQDMLTRLDAALARPGSGERLRQRMLGQYPVALIDEFQDTSPLQFRLFDRVYGVTAATPEADAGDAPASALLLIGDPKQSIYGFRGADIDSYLRARQATEGRHHVLGTNHRSTRGMVAVVNHLFGQGESRPGPGAFLYRSLDGGESGAAPRNPLPFVAVGARGRAEQLVCQGAAWPALTIEHDLTLRASGDVRRLFAARCAEQVVAWLNDPGTGFATPDGPWQRVRPADIAILVRTGGEAAAVRQALQRRGVASVYLSDRESVFASDEARDLVHWLRAVAQPQDLRLARAGLATRLVGLSLPELAHLAQDDDALDARLAQLHQLRTVWQGRGVLSMLRRTLHLLDLPARWLQQVDGERRLTNLLHLGELLQAASAGLDGEHGLIRWLLAEMQDHGGGGEEQIVRLESDADLVKVITVHKSKGLEYPLVCLPFATAFRAQDNHRLRHLHVTTAEGQRELKLQLDDADRRLADLDRLREDMRLLYVALTRARHAVWLGFGATQVGNGSTCQTHRSALGRLVGGDQPLDADDWLPFLQRLASSDPVMAGQVGLRAADEVPGVTRLQSPGALLPLRELAPYNADFERDWGVGSFSALVRDLGPAVSPLLPHAQGRPADDEYKLFGAPVLSVIGVSAMDSGVLNPTAYWHRFERGPQAGNFVHDQLEWLAHEGFALDASPELAQRLVRRCERLRPKDDAMALVDWFRQVVTTPLAGLGTALDGLAQVLPEMGFWLPVERLRARDVDALCQVHLLPGLPRPALPERALHGMLMGFADLVCQHEGRFWVLDYKSNHLGTDGAAYTADAMAAEMARHRYDVQAALYLLALHRLLRSRLGPDYDPATQLGGALYFFVRGIDGPQRGCHVLPPPLALLDALDALLAPEEATA